MSDRGRGERGRLFTIMPCQVMPARIERDGHQCLQNFGYNVCNNSYTTPFFFKLRHLSFKSIVERPLRAFFLSSRISVHLPSPCFSTPCISAVTSLSVHLKRRCRVAGTARTCTEKLNECMHKTNYLHFKENCTLKP